jgi:hypothetical protein
MPQDHPVKAAIFFREEGFYPVQFSGTKPMRDEAADHAALNLGTVRIEDMEGNVLWPMQ